VRRPEEMLGSGCPHACNCCRLIPAVRRQPLPPLPSRPACVALPVLLLVTGLCSAASAVDFHSNGQLVTGGADKEVKVWEVSRPALTSSSWQQLAHPPCIIRWS
jgi:WD40 repeat protein